MDANYNFAESFSRIRLTSLNENENQVWNGISFYVFVVVVVVVMAVVQRQGSRRNIPYFKISEFGSVVS